MTPDGTYYTANIQKIDELQEFARWPFTQGMDECFALGLQFHITEAARTQDRQNRYFVQGRDPQIMLQEVNAGKITRQDYEAGLQLLKTIGSVPGSRITWTLHSKHTENLAVDLYPVGFSGQADELNKLSRIAGVLSKYGIVRPSLTLANGDYGHFECQNAKPIIVKPITPEAKLKGLKRRLANTKNEDLLKQIQGEIDVLTRRAV